jgi:hypothetical protein
MANAVMVSSVKKHLFLFRSPKWGRVRHQEIPRMRDGCWVIHQHSIDIDRLE